MTRVVITDKAAKKLNAFSPSTQRTFKSAFNALEAYVPTTSLEKYKLVRLIETDLYFKRVGQYMLILSLTQFNAESVFIVLDVVYRTKFKEELDKSKFYSGLT